MMDWIPVKWREPDKNEAMYFADEAMFADFKLPDDGEEILVTTNSGVVEVDIAMYDDDGWYLDSGNGWEDIKAWMPLPEPYKEEP